MESDKNIIVNIEHVQSSYLKEKINPKSVSTTRQATSQFVAVLTVNIMSISIGTCIGFIRIVIPNLHEKDSDISVATEELTWISSIMFFLTPVGYALSGPLTQYFGRRQILLLIAIPFSVEWFVLYRARNSTTLMISLGLMGITGGLVHSPIMMYVTEITRPHLRGAFLTICPLAINFGIFMETLINHYVGWRTTALINLAYPLVGFIGLLFIPESPHWLASNGRVDETERALCWLRGWATKDCIKPEFRYVCKIFAKRGYPVGVAADESTNQSLLLKLKPYSKRTFWVPFFLLLFILSIKAFGGTVVMQTFTTMIFDWLKSPIEKKLATTITGAVELISCGISVSIIHFTGKRMLTIISALILSIFYFLLAFYCWSIKQDEPSQIYKFTAFMLIISIAFFSQTGIKIIPHILMGEIFPMETRSIGISFVNTVGFCLVSIANKIFYYEIEDIKMMGTFLCFGVINFVGCIILYFVLPETEGKTLQEIEKYFTNVKYYSYQRRTK